MGVHEVWSNENVPGLVLPARASYGHHSANSLISMCLPFRLVALKLMNASTELLSTHYEDLSSKGFFAGLIKYMSSGPVCCMVWEGLNAVTEGRKMLGATKPSESAPGEFPFPCPPTTCSVFTHAFLSRNLQAPFVATTRWTWAATSATGPTPSSPRRRRLPCGSPRASRSGTPTPTLGCTRSK